MYIDKKILYAISISSVAALFLALIIPENFGRVIGAALLLPLAVIVCRLVKKRSILSINKKAVLGLMAVIALLYLILYYLTGLHFGFYRSIYTFEFSLFTKFIFPIAVMIISGEIMRSVLRAQNNKLVDVLVYVIGVLSEVLILSTLGQIQTFNKFMDVVGLTFLPAITANLLYHYLSKRYGAVPNIVYRSLITIFPYIIPYTSAIPDSLYAFVKILIPLLIYWFIDMLYEKKRRFAVKKKNKLSYVGAVLLAAVLLSFVMLISCQFRYGALVIATDSMTGEVNKGDAVIFEQYDDQTIVVGQVIVFRKDNNLIVHRVVDIKRINGFNRYYTKGDVNEDLDVGYITDADVVGLAYFKVPFVGYPTIFVRSLFA
ncbi:MAG: signal peptidase I [Clostridia bacterium]|nr:signal peptidase I [Clostridia bacterium]